METVWGGERSQDLVLVQGLNPAFLLISCVTSGRLDSLSEQVSLPALEDV